MQKKYVTNRLKFGKALDLKSAFVYNNKARDRRVRTVWGRKGFDGDFDAM